MSLPRQSFVYLVIFVGIGNGVFAEFKQADFLVLHSKQVTNVDSTSFSRSGIECADSCLTAGNCSSATFYSSSNQCHLSTDGSANITAIVDESIVTMMRKDLLPKPAVNGHFGTVFFTGFMSNEESNLGVPYLLMVSAVPEPTNVFVTIPCLNISQEHHILDDYLYLQYDVSLMPELTSIVSFKGVEIVSDNPFTLYSLNHWFYAADGTLELPKEKWGQLYIIGTHNSSWWGTGQILVVAAENNTEVLLEIPSGFSLSIVLNKYETYQYMGNVSIAGTLVSANKPIVVHAGHMCANIPDHNTVYCDFIMENMPPVNTLGSVFVVPYQRTRSMYTLGIAAPHNDTNVEIMNVSGNVLETIAMGSQDSIFRNYYESEILSISSSQNILVTQYGHGSSNIYGDPSLTIVPAITQFINRCNFEVPPIFTDPSVVSIIIDSFFDMQGLHLNGSPIVPAESASVLIPGIGTFDVIYINVTSNVTYSLYHNDLYAKFGAILYARNSLSEYTTVLGYGL